MINVVKPTGIQLPLVDLLAESLKPDNLVFIIVSNGIAAMKDGKKTQKCGQSQNPVIPDLEAFSLLKIHIGKTLKDQDNFRICGGWKFVNDFLAMNEGILCLTLF